MPALEDDADASRTEAELRDFWRAFDVHRLQLRMQLMEALGARPFGLGVLSLLVPDPVSSAGAQHAQHQRHAWLGGDWRGLDNRIAGQIERLIDDGLQWPTWFDLQHQIREVLLHRVLDGYSADPARGRSALQGVGRVLDHLTARVGEAMRPPPEDDADRQFADDEADQATTPEETIRIVFDAAPVAMLSVASDGTITAGNRQAESMLGYVRGGLDGLPLEDLLPEDIRPRHVKLRARFAEMPTARPMAPDKQLKARRKDGTEIRIEVGLTPYDGDTGKLVLASLFEVTQDHQTAARLRRAMAELERSNEELEQFAYVVSHDLQEPLRMVSSYSELLRRQYHGQLDENADMYINYAVDGAQRLSRVVQELLNYSRVGSKAGSFVPTNTAQMVEVVCADLGLALDASGAEVFVEGRLPTIVADSSQLQLVFQNLIGNAIKFAREGVAPQVRLRAERKAELWQFTVSDNGIGIEEKFVERIFGLFQRLHSREAYEGSGIGLTITRRVIERHGGRIWVESTPDEGSTFFFSLPLWPVTL